MDPVTKEKALDVSNARRNQKEFYSFNSMYFAEEDVEDIILLLNNPNAMINYTTELLQYKICQYLQILQKGGFYPERFVKKNDPEETIEAQAGRYGFNLYQYFADNFKSSEEFREYLSGVAGIEFVSFDAVRVAKQQLDAGEITKLDFENVESKAGIKYNDVFPNWSYSFPDSRLNNQKHGKYLNSDNLPKIVSSGMSM